MVQVQVNVASDEVFDKALARFKKICSKEGIVTEIKKRSFYEKPSEKRRRIEMKRQRKMKSRSFQSNNYNRYNRYGQSGQSNQSGRPNQSSRPNRSRTY